LVLRQFEPADTPRIVALCSSFEVAKNTLTIPHPYSLADAEAFLKRVANGAERRDSYTWGITLATPAGEPGELQGAIGLRCDWTHRHAEAGYILGEVAWGHGYATEALRAVIRFAFTRTPLVRLHAAYFARNPASGRVLEKCGFTREGLRPSMYERFGERVDSVLMGLLKDHGNECPP
jgi:RimJ/RimL family protein N-acetyltransferase